MLARDPSVDLAVLAIAARDLIAASLGDTAALRPGELVVALGHPLGVANAVSLGVVHEVVREPDGTPRWVTADLRLAPGNSGGPLAGADGRVVGINTLVAGGLGYRAAGAADRPVSPSRRVGVTGRKGGVTRVLVAASSPTIRAGLGALLAGQHGLTVLEAPGRPALLADLAETVEADVVLLALEPGEPLPLPLALPPDSAGREPAVVVVGDDTAEGWMQRALRAGARGVLPRGASGEQIAAAVVAAAVGLSVQPAVSSRAPVRPTLNATAPAQPLTPREVEVLTMLAEGLANKAIAGRLAISEHTVKTHVAAVFGKLGVSTRAEAVAIAARIGMLML